MILLVINVFWHFRLGLQVVLEDYQHDESKIVGLILINFYAIGGAALAIFSILKIAFGGVPA
jgi:succinate dehydrogenase / fumarate reductase membrane anchor subunit